MIIDSHAHYNNNAYKKPFCYLSYDKDVCARNTSLILPAVIPKTGSLKRISADEVERATMENTTRLFHLPV